MRKGYQPGYSLDKKGEIFAIWTGSDACSEHEIGSKPLLGLATGVGMNAEDYGRQVKAGKILISDVPPLEVRRAIKSNCEVLLEMEGNDVAIGIGAKAGLFNNRELKSYSREEEDCLGAWDSRSFGFILRGKRSQKLKEFHKAMQDGRVMFGGSFLSKIEGNMVSGVCLCRSDLMRPEHMKLVKAANEQFMKDVVMHSVSNIDEVRKFVGSKESESSTYVWTSTVRESTGEILYGLNAQTGSRMKYGSYTQKEIEEALGN